MTSRKQISQPAKISQRKFFIEVLFLLFYGLFSFWFLICNVEFDSNSSCLDRLNNFGINSLEKL